MSAYEDFIRELLRNNLITEYQSDQGAVQKYFNGNFKQKANCSFEKFCSKLWKNWYVIEFKKNVIYFDEKWLDYISKTKKAQNTLKKEMSSKQKVSGESCQLCLLKFSSENDFQDHVNSIKHKVRELYLNNTENFDHRELIKFELMGTNNVKDNHNASIKLKFERKVHAHATIKAISICENNIEIIEVVQVNPHNKGITVNTKFEKEKTLRHGGNFRILIKGYFENSASFKLPIVVVFRIAAEEEMTYFLKEIIVEVSSEFSSLKAGEPYKKLKKVTLPRKNDEIILGEIPVGHASSYKETYPLKQYPIPTGLQIRLRDLIRSYPLFVEKYAPENADSFYNMFATVLNLHTSLIEANYFDLLDALLSIEENQIMVDVRDYDTMSKLTFIGGNTYDLEVPGLAEARPSLVVHDAVYVKENVADSKKFQGIVSSVFEKSVRLSFNRK
uniref:Putative RNA helicase n=1 Tax=Anoplophora glabripennis TaxID=217634 RepID=V5H1S2_ANOGL